MNISYRVGFEMRDKKLVSILYDESFGRKLLKTIRSRQKRRDLIQHSLDPKFCISAYSNDHLYGLIGFKNNEGGLILTSNMGLRSLIQAFGLFQGVWFFILSISYKKKRNSPELLIDEIVIDAQCRGQGAGDGLLRELKIFARDNGYKSIRLNFFNETPRSRRFYQKHGFVDDLEILFSLKRLFSIGQPKQMILKL